MSKGERSRRRNYKTEENKHQNGLEISGVSETVQKEKQPEINKHSLNKKNLDPWPKGFGRL